MKNNPVCFVLALASAFFLNACSHSTAPGLKSPPPVQEDLSIYKTADTLWEHTGSLLDALDIDPTKADAAAKTKAQSALVLAQASAQKFIDTYPKDERRWKAHLLVIRLQEAYAGYGLTPVSSDELARQLSLIAKAPDAPTELQAGITSQLISIALEKSAKQPDAAALTALDDQIGAFEKKYGDTFALGQNRPPEIAVLRLQQLQLLLDHGSADQVKGVMDKIKAMALPQLVEFAQRMVDQHQVISQFKEKAFDLKFTAVDGRVVDFTQLRGKVVLLDFWATWCGPCVQEMPSVIAAYQKYHSQGLEIIGVSLDQDKKQLLDFTQKNGMAWPQFFDGQGWQNALAKQYHVEAIPAMWLIDKKGQLRETGASEGLEDKIAKLLAE